ncbi:sulfotransferase [bacterium]|nr:sulfotransferase [bacterium]
MKTAISRTPQHRSDPRAGFLKMAALTCVGRAGTKLVQSYLDGHPNLRMIPGYPLMYLYPHWETWRREYGNRLTWHRVIDLFCEKHASVIDTRRLNDLLGLDRLGPTRQDFLAINESGFRKRLLEILSGSPICRKTFLLAVHEAYAESAGAPCDRHTVVLYHIHEPDFVRDLVDDFPEMKLIVMVREPKASFASTKVAEDFVDQAKLNPTDCMILSGKNVVQACYYQQKVMESLGDIVRDHPGVDLLAVRHDDLHLRRDQTLTAILRWLGIPEHPAMRVSTFGGKLWWGDATNRTPVNGYNADALSDKWRKTLSCGDGFLIEGLQYELCRAAGYEPAYYRKDDRHNRIRLILRVLLPMREEWRLLGRALDPRQHMAFIWHAWAESASSRIDYSWSATYRYKRAYQRWGLWRRRWEEGLLSASPKRPARIVFVIVRYLRFLGAALRAPLWVLHRYRMNLGTLRYRLTGKSYCPLVLRPETVESVEQVPIF